MAEFERDGPGRETNRSARLAKSQSASDVAAEAARVERVARCVSWASSNGGGAASISSAEANRERCRAQLKALLQRKAEALDLSCMGITELPAELSSFGAGLRRLSLRDNLLQRLPLPVCSLTELRELDLRGNALSDLPPELASLKQLTHLSLDANMLRSVPAAVLALPRLEALHLEKNQLTSLPAALFAPRLGGGANALTDLRCLGNPITKPPPAVLEAGVDAARRWFREQEAKLLC